MNGKSKSILLQVAFKEASSGTPIDIDVVEANYTTLLALHEKFGIDADDAPSRSYGGGSAKKEAPAGVTFMFENNIFEDFRTLKSDGTLKPSFPDFRTVSGTEVAGLTNDRGSVWIIDRDGSAKAEVAALVAAADAAAVLA